MLPPASTAQTGPSPGTRPPSSAATGAAPAPSTTSFDRSSRSTIACEIASSSTTTISSSRSRRIAVVSSAGYLTAIPSAIVGPVGRAPRVRRARCCLHADERQLRPQRAEPDRDPAGEAAAADRDHDRPRPGGELLGELEPERPLAGDDARVVERVDEGRAGRLDVSAGRGDGVVEALPAEHDRRAVAAGRLDLRHRRALWDEDRGGDAGLARRPRDGLSVVARARRDDARLPLRLAQLRDRVVGAADLERARELQVLGLERDRAADERAERARRRAPASPARRPASRARAALRSASDGRSVTTSPREARRRRSCRRP